MRRTLNWTLFALAVILFITGNQIVTFLTDLLWFTQLGFRSVALTVLRTQALLAVILGGLFFLIVYSNVWIARRWAPPVPRFYQEIGAADRIGEFARRSLGVLLLLGSLAAAALAAMEATNHWQQYLLWRHSVPFNVKDPIFSRDISFYIFQLPFITYFYRWLFFALLVAFAAAAWVHYTDRALQFTQNVPIPQFVPHVKTHLSILLALILFVLGYGYWLRQYGLLQSDFGNLSLNGAGYTDVHSRLFAFQVMAAGCAAVGVLLLVNLGMRGLALPGLGLAGLIGLSLIVGVLYPGFMQAYVVGPNDSKVELPYIAHNINFTRQAYQLDRIAEKTYDTDQELTAKDLGTHRETLQNVRLWDYRMLKQVYTQQQGLRPYYTFQDVDVDRYAFKTGYRQVMLSAREFDVTRAPQQTWVSRKLQYTHGYGAVMNSVSTVSSEGAPEYLLKDMPPKPEPGLEADLKLDKPQIYFGTVNPDPANYVIVNTDQDEFDYPSGDEDKRTRYDGADGIPISSYGRKLLFALRFGDTNLVLSKLLGPQAKLLLYRQVQQRVAMLAPFLIQDHDPYLVVANGRFFWMLDCYTATDRYPYSQPINLSAASGINYLRNSVKVTVDAYDGTVRFYVFDKTDPVLQAYRSIFPILFSPSEQMPAALRAHIRYPEDLFEVQSQLYTRYHMKDSRVFYTQSDAWSLATEGSSQSDDPLPMEPYYVTMRLPGSDQLQFVLIRPFTPKDKQNMSAWLAVSCEPEPGSYAQATVYKFPKSTITQGPAQIEARIHQDQVISPKVSLWNQQGSRVNWGNLLVIPLDRSMLYIQPLYLEAGSGTAKMPELKQVVVATDQPQRVVMAPSLDEALSEMLGSTVTTSPGPTPAPAGTGKPSPAPVAAPKATADLIRSANQQFDAAESAQRNGDWAAYGRSLQQLKQTLQQLKAQSQ